MWSQKSRKMGPVVFFQHPPLLVLWGATGYMSCVLHLPTALTFEAVPEIGDRLSFCTSEHSFSTLIYYLFL